MNNDEKRKVVDEVLGKLRGLTEGDSDVAGLSVRTPLGDAIRSVERLATGVEEDLVPKPLLYITIPMICLDTFISETLQQEFRQVARHERD